MKRDSYTDPIFVEDANYNTNTYQSQKLQNISYTVLESNQADPDETTRNLRTVLDINLMEGLIKFIAPNQFEEWNQKDKLLIYGLSGSGKSRIIYEILRSNICHYRNIHIISPRKAIGISGRESIFKYLDKNLVGTDALVWDNFPDGKVQKDFDIAKRMIQELSSYPCEKMLIAIKPKYMELYRKLDAGNPEVYSAEVSYDKRHIKSAIEEYGKNNSRYKELYEKYIEDNIDEISLSLWKKEPVPLIVENYYTEISTKQKELLEGSTDAVNISNTLSRPTDFYRERFKRLSAISDRRSDVDFLFTLKLCYELGISSTIDHLEHLQEKIFGSQFKDEPLAKLSTWLFLQGPYYSMYDTTREAIEYSQDLKIKILFKLSEIFHDIIPNNDDNTTYLFGLFFGRNFQLMPPERQDLFMSKSGYMGLNRNFIYGLIDGIGKIFPYLDEDQQLMLLARAEEEKDENTDYSSFAFILGYYLGYHFSTFNGEFQKKLLELVIKENGLANGVSFGLGLNFRNLSNGIRNNILTVGKHSNNIGFYVAFSNSIRYIFTDTYSDIHEAVLNNIKENDLFARTLGASLGHIFFKLDKKFQNILIDRNDFISWGIGYTLGKSLKQYDEERQKNVRKIIEKEDSFSIGLGYGTSIGLQDIHLKDFNDIKDTIWQICKENKSFAESLAYSICNLLPSLLEIQEEIFSQVMNKSYFGIYLISEMGRTFIDLDKEFQKKVLRISETDDALMRIFGFGLGVSLRDLPLNKRLQVKDLDPEVRKEIAMLTKNNINFATGINKGLSYKSDM